MRLLMLGTTHPFLCIPEWYDFLSLIMVFAWEDDIIWRLDLNYFHCCGLIILNLNSSQLRETYHYNDEQERTQESPARSRCNSMGPIISVLVDEAPNQQGSRGCPPRWRRAIHPRHKQETHRSKSATPIIAQVRLLEATEARLLQKRDQEVGRNHRPRLFTIQEPREAQHVVWQGKETWHGRHDSRRKEIRPLCSDLDEPIGVSRTFNNAGQQREPALSARV